MNILNLFYTSSNPNAEAMLLLGLFDQDLYFYYNGSCVHLSNFLREIFFKYMYTFKDIIYDVFTINCDEKKGDENNCDEKKGDETEKDNLRLLSNLEFFRKYEQKQISLENFVEELGRRQEEERQRSLKSIDRIIMWKAYNFLELYILWKIARAVYLIVSKYFPD